MLELGADSFSTVLTNAASLASWPVPPLLLLCYVCQSIRAQRIRSEFSLRRFESIELERATQLHNKLSQRITELKDHGKRPFSWRSILLREADISEQQVAELDDLEAYAQHLKITIVRLSRQPLQRLRSWLHIKSSKFAIREAIQSYLAIFALLLIIAFHPFDQSLAADGLKSVLNNQLVWHPLDELFVYGNALISMLAVLAVPASTCCDGPVCADNTVWSSAF